MYLRSLRNSQYILRSKPSFALHFNRKYAIVYGAGNSVGFTFAKFFALKGFNLILIDDSEHKLMILESEIWQLLGHFSSDLAYLGNP